MREQSTVQSYPVETKREESAITFPVVDIDEEASRYGDHHSHDKAYHREQIDNQGRYLEHNDR